MDISIVKTLPDNVVKALCNTLVHSLWQGLVLAAVAGLVVIFTRKASSAMRYNLLVVSLMLFAGVVAYTFVSELRSTHDDIIANTLTRPQPVEATHFTVNNSPITIHHSVLDGFIGYFNTHANLIVMIWLLVVCARSIQLATGLNSLYHLRRRHVFEVSKDWQNRVYELSAKLGITRMVGIAESGIAKVPMVIGYLKPIILIPVGLITALSAAEVDAILVHELAHIRRRDYLVNLLQSLMEIIFFFNPAVLWISNLIKTERENCCDDIAIAQTSNKANYIRALVLCQEYQVSAPAYAMAFSGKKNHLLGRVKRMVSNSNQSLNLLEKSLLAVCLLAAGLVTTAFNNADKINKLINTTTTAVNHVIKKEIIPVAEPAEKIEPASPVNALPVTQVAKSDVLAPADTSQNKLNIWQPSDIAANTSFSGPNGSYISYINNQTGVLYQINYKNNAFSSLQVNGKTIPNDKIVDYQPTIDKIVNLINDPASQYKNKMTLNAEKARLDRLNKLGDINAKEHATVKAGADSVNKKVQLSSSKMALGYQPQTLNNNATKSANVPYKNNYKHYDRSSDDSMRNSLIADMVTDGIIPSKTSALSFKLSTSEFIVNGKRQPYEVYQKYRANYVKATGKDEWAWLYNFDIDTKAATETKSVTKVTTSN